MPGDIMYERMRVKFDNWKVVAIVADTAPFAPFMADVKDCSTISLENDFRMLTGPNEVCLILGESIAEDKKNTISLAIEKDKPEPILVVKEIRTGKKPNRIKRAEREIAITQHLSKHSNIVTLHNAYFDSVSGIFYMVMPFYEGSDFYYQQDNLGVNCRDFIDDSKVELILKAQFFSMSRALSFCHKNNILFKDVKPENFFLDANGNLVLSDFGLAAYLNPPQDPNNPEYKYFTMPGGSPYYCSRALLKSYFQEDCSLIDKSVDTDPLAYMLYLFLTGDLPYLKYGNIVVPDDKEIDENDLYGAIRKFQLTDFEPPNKKSWEHLFFSLINKKISFDEAMMHSWFDDVRGEDGGLKEDPQIKEALRHSIELTLNHSAYPHRDVQKKINDLKKWESFTSKKPEESGTGGRKKKKNCLQCVLI